MAEEQDILAELEAGEAEGGKGKFPLKMVIILVLVLALGGGGYFAYMNFFQQAEEETSAETPGDGSAAVGQGETSGQGTATGSAAKQQEPVGVMVPLEPFIVNLAGSQGKRFLKVTMTLELNDPGTRPEYNDNTEKIVDSILVLLSSKTFEEVYSVQGKFKLKDEITTRVNRFLLVGHVKDIYFTEFVIQ
ncbi:MAG: hypothetical protein G3M70_12890 [Candidatus Nitronauta litoralis]|uniref:Flagellar protein FliL n=1 Tax=Candidatus Nitronauta litoralis TaxID=2705533 RepID=A0A7T0BXH7_9BACT|nr:MAG: hypothetical protein G3M70_12890 [Candidatus Nitronauta litoralis]